MRIVNNMNSVKSMMDLGGSKMIVAYNISSILYYTSPSRSMQGKLGKSLC